MKSQSSRLARIIHGEGRPTVLCLVVSTGKGKAGTDFDEVNADTLVVSVGARPRILASAKPDGERILTWTQLTRSRRSPST